MKINHIEISINQPADPQCSAPARQRLKAAFDELRQLSRQHWLQNHSQNQATASQGFLLASDLSL